LSEIEALLKLRQHLVETRDWASNEIKDIDHQIAASEGEP